MKSIILVVVAIVGFIVLLVYVADQDEKQWQQFSSDHHCHETGRIEASIGSGYSTSGHYGVITTPAKSTFTCDGGYTVTRDAE